MTTADLDLLLRQKKKLPPWAYEEILGSFSAGAGLLFYYRNDNAGEADLKGALNLRGCDGIECVPPERAVGRLQHGFRIHIPGEQSGVLELAAESAEVRPPRLCPTVAALTPPPIARLTTPASY
jgi:hypothetical protein